MKQAMNWEKFREMPFPQKAEYIWDYYRWPILGTLFAIVAVVSLVVSIVSQKPVTLDVVMVNAYTQDSSAEAFRPLLEKNGYEYYEGAVVVHGNMQLGGIEDINDPASMQLMACLVAARTTDLFFWDKEEVIPPVSRGVLADLRQILSPELLEENRDRLVYDRDEQTGEEYPCAVFLQEDPWTVGNGFYRQCSVGVASTAPSRELAAAFLTDLLTGNAMQQP